MPWLNVSKRIHSSFKKHFFCFQAWSACRNGVVSAISERLTATTGNPTCPISEIEVSTGEGGECDTSTAQRSTGCQGLDRV